MSHQWTTPLFDEGDMSMDDSEGDEVTQGLALTMLHGPTAVLEARSLKALHVRDLEEFESVLPYHEWWNSTRRYMWRGSTHLTPGHATPHDVWTTL